MNEPAVFPCAQVRTTQETTLEHDVLHDENHEIDTFTLEELLFDIRLSQSRAKHIEDIFHELSLFGAHRILLTIPLHMHEASTSQSIRNTLQGLTESVLRMISTPSVLPSSRRLGLLFCSRMERISAAYPRFSSCLGASSRLSSHGRIFVLETSCVDNSTLKPRIFSKMPASRQYH